MQRKQFYATKRLQEVRNERGLTQQEMADTLSLVLERDISHSLYQKWEQGTVSVRLKDAIAMSRELDIKVKELWRIAK